VLRPGDGPVEIREVHDGFADGECAAMQFQAPYEFQPGHGQAYAHGDSAGGFGHLIRFDGALTVDRELVEPLVASERRS
jgi:hypothetical protein